MLRPFPPSPLVPGNPGKDTYGHGVYAWQYSLSEESFGGGVEGCKLEIIICWTHGPYNFPEGVKLCTCCIHILLVDLHAHTNTVRFLYVCVCVYECIMEVRCSGGGARLVTHVTFVLTN